MINSFYLPETSSHSFCNDILKNETKQVTKYKHFIYIKRSRTFLFSLGNSWASNVLFKIVYLALDIRWRRGNTSWSWTTLYFETDDRYNMCVNLKLIIIKNVNYSVTVSVLTCNYNFWNGLAWNIDRTLKQTKSRKELSYWFFSFFFF